MSIYLLTSESIKQNRYIDILNSNQIQKIKQVLDSSGFIKKAWVFGSVARNEETNESDIDIMFEKIPNAHFGLIKLNKIWQMLET